MTIPNNDQTIDMLKKEIRQLVEQIMDPDIDDEERYYLNAHYNDCLKSLKWFNGTMREVFTKDGWKIL